MVYKFTKVYTYDIGISMLKYIFLFYIKNMTIANRMLNNTFPLHTKMKNHSLK